MYEAILCYFNLDNFAHIDPWPAYTATHISDYKYSETRSRSLCKQVGTVRTAQNFMTVTNYQSVKRLLVLNILSRRYYKNEEKKYT